MSYDLVGVRVQDGESVEDAVERLEELADDDAPPTDAEWDRMRSLGDRLAAAGPAADRFEDRAAGVVELTTERLQVAVYRHEAAITIPYWTDGGRDDPGVAVAGEYVAVLARLGGFTIWDRQAERVVSPDAAGRQVDRGYARSARVALASLDHAAGSDARARRARWHFWKR